MNEAVTKAEPDEVVFGQPLTFGLWPIAIRTVHVDARSDTSRQCLLIFGKWLMPTSRWYHDAA